MLLFVCVLQGCSKQGPTTTQSVQSGKPVTFFAAASTIELVKAFGDDLAGREHIAVVGSYGASSTLARQIEAGAPCDIFLSADSKWMDELEHKNLLEPGTRRELMGNELILIVPKDKKIAMKFEPSFEFSKVFPGRLAVGDPTHVPAGIYARQALEHLGWWSGIQNRILPAGDVRQALRLVERGEADAGIVYATDVIYTDSVEVAGVFPADTHQPIRYVVAGCKGMSKDAARVLSYLQLPAAQNLIVRHGFQALVAETSSPATSSASR